MDREKQSSHTHNLPSQAEKPERKKKQSLSVSSLVSSVSSHVYDSHRSKYRNPIYTINRLKIDLLSVTYFALLCKFKLHFIAYKTQISIDSAYKILPASRQIKFPPTFRTERENEKSIPSTSDFIGEKGSELKKICINSF